MNDFGSRKWTFANVSAAEAGDFLQITFRDDPVSSDRYVLISTQFEFPQEHHVQVETNQGECFAQLVLSASSLSRTKLTLDARDDTKPMILGITFDANESDFDELKRVLKIMLPDINLVS